jgi:hypothetical protein
VQSSSRRKSTQIARSRSERIDCLFNFLSPVIVPPELLRAPSKIFDQFSSRAPEMAGRRLGELGAL